MDANLLVRMPPYETGTCVSEYGKGMNASCCADMGSSPSKE